LTIIPISNGVLSGLSTDTKPVSPAGYEFIETDTGDEHLSDGTYWWIKTLGPLSAKKIGIYPAGVTNTVGLGLFSTMVGGTSAGSQSFALDTTNGRYLGAVTGTTTGTKGGVRAAGPLFLRPYNPRFRIRFSVTDTTAVTLYIGFFPVAEPTGTAPMDTGSQGVLFGLNNFNTTNFVVMHNDNAGTTIADSTGTAIDTGLHTLKLVADDANVRYSWSLDGGAYTHITGNIPANNTNQTLIMQNETQADAAKNWRIYNVFAQSDK
jgi:hypothetical protein